MGRDNKDHKGKRPSAGRGKQSNSADRGPKKNFSRGKSSPFKKRVVKKSTAEGMRLNQYIAHAGICSRREADKFIDAGLVTVNDEVVTSMGYRVKPSDQVKFNNELIRSEKKKYLLLNKPKGYITTSDDPKKRKTVFELIEGACKERLYPIGRLDRQTTGLLLFTNDGVMAKKLTNPAHKVKKIYHITLDKNLTAADMRKFGEGVAIEDGTFQPEKISYINNAPKKEVGMEVFYGKNSAIRTAFSNLGYNVIKMDRVYFGNLTKKDVPRGRYRFLTEQEVSMLKMI
jgi:23S rRNA pseudouridine2605 synthase